ncbi:unnamed protein product [Dibothriocephalus latus]|uniref:Fibronectin type-III domain-containing protein n=1 Tax=Dibothriocephalus latus TaxID=60516 RepID=A0A3P6TWY3_DIBLA|nr:unnamed protein product [Dibothriocephalus latus]
MNFSDANADHLIEGKKLKVVCEASPPGKPVGGLLWRWYIPSPNSSTDPTARLLPPIPSAPHCPPNSDVDNLFFGREVFTYEDVAPDFYVQNPPRKLTIELKNGRLLKGFYDGREELVAFGKENTVLKFNCKTSPYFGTVTIKWLKKMGGFSMPLNPTAPQRTFNYDNTKRQVSESTLDVVMPTHDQVGVLICEAWADDRVVVEKAIRLDILYGKPLITTYTQSVSAAGVSLKFELVSQVKDNGALIRCVAKNDASPEGVMSDPVTLDIMFPPSHANLTSRQGESVAAGEELELMCETGLSNPPAAIKWRYYHCSPAKLYFEKAYVSIPAFIPAENVTSDTLTRLYSEIELGGWKGCAMKQLEGIDDPPTSQEKKGFLSRGRLKLQPKWQDHADFVECLAENDAYGPLTAQAIIRLNVTFAPQFLGLQTGSEHSVVEDKTSSTIRRQMKSASGVFAGNPNARLLTLWNVKRRHMNNYTIEATNAVGTKSSTFILNITYPPEMVLTRMVHVNVTLGDTAHLNCEVHANPAVAEGAFLWRRFISPEWNTEGHLETAVATEPIGCNNTTMESTLTIYDVTSDDVGEYECIANNGIGPSTVGKVNLYSSFPPSIVKLPRYAKAAASFGTRLTMTCFIFTEPEPIVAWLMRRKPDGVLVAYDAKCDKFIAPDEKPDCLRNAPPVSKRRLQATLVRLRPGHFLAKMNLGSVQSDDFSEYTCQVTSPSGQDSFVIAASGTGPPDTPMRPNVLNVTATTIRISWIQGFGGGYKQTFRVRWKINKPEAHYKYEDLVEKESGATMQLFITALKPDTDYTISLNARNEMHGESPYSEAVIVRTELGMPPFSYTFTAFGYLCALKFAFICYSCVVLSGSCQHVR